jgi:DNA-directed RNA polymerase subunit E'/Rpb7
VRRASDIATVREIEGDEAERASIKARTVEFIERKIGEEYWGIVSGVKDFGFFVMLEENLIEGLVHVASLGDDYYTPDSTGTMLIGARGGRYYRIGDRVLVKVDKVDRERREIDFRLVMKERSNSQLEAAPEPVGRSGRRARYRKLERKAKKVQAPGRRRGSRSVGSGRDSGGVTRSLKSRRRKPRRGPGPGGSGKRVSRRKA